MAKIIDETQEYVTVEFEEDDIENDDDIRMIDNCIIRGIDFEFLNEEETILKIHRKGGNDMSELIVWFNVGVGNAHWSIWQTCICDGNFSPESFRFETCRWDENGENPETIWVTREGLNHTLPKETLRAFENIEDLLIEVKDAYECRHDVGFRGAEIHIYDVFDMSNKDEWGLGKALWD